ncbi:class 1b ribonucleoside-diphosphate reductase subunit alpha [Paenibacillus sp. P22]|uniref:class 1b ribonucleoside-diphosphate reductase subunit alpha n=1 Tax=Paenibacillus sp. P22 TaxID=483908 RepID=UPI0004057339|nr:class 1b ribonucleoside-diphosphate reductase subunit alpha [Paenibacillus sp. P22]CDN42047.1 Ribonucleoside-diphosphate reductase subunit alpha [Paenibacillus sp. P22]
MKRGEDGFFQLEKDAEAVREFMAEVAAKTKRFDTPMERIRWLVDYEFYYGEVESQYDVHQLVGIHDICDAYDFRFASFMAASKFYKDYALQTNDKSQYLETYAQHVAIVALYLGQGNYALAERLARSMMEQRLQPATPTFLNAGRARRGEMVSCFLLEADDSLNSINYVLSTCMQLSKIGGGVAVNLSKLRGRGEPIKGVEGAAKGIMPVLKLMEDAFSYADQMGQRKGSGAAYYNIFGWDVVEFLDTKKINADEKARLKTLSIGLIVPRKFYELARDNRPLHVFAQHSVFKAYGAHLDDMDITEMYEELLANPAVKKREIMSARDMLTKIATTQLESGYPYIMNRDNANEGHPLAAIGTVKMSNLCTEVYQLQESSTIGNFGEPSVIRRDISCNLASLNIVNVMESGKVRESVHEGIEALTVVSDISRIENAPGVRLANDELHSVGLGAMNLHGYLAKNKIAYDSEEGRDFARTFFAMMNYYSLEKSAAIARERRITFKDFAKSTYADGTYFTKYLAEDFAPRTDRVAEMFAGIDIPSPNDWATLKDTVMEYGLYHAYRLAIAPTQSISYIQNATSSVMPIVELIEERTYANATTFYPMPFLSAETQWFYKSAYKMDQAAVIDMVAEIQAHVDQGISAILHVNSDVSTRELSRFYVYAGHRGLKGLYYTRTNLLSVEQCTSCAV